ncbi:MAG: hypothetical protein ACLFWG_00025 [Longimicrobiales bacterium]
MSPEVPPAMILGGAECLWDDVAELERMVGGVWPGVVIAVNNAGVDWDRPLDHWVSMHPEKFHRECKPGKGGEWIRRRRERGHPDGYVTWARREVPTLADRQVEVWAGGSSGLLAVAVADILNCPLAVLCGVPMDRRPHYHDVWDGKPWVHADAHWPAWTSNEDRLQGWVRSMSGRTREFLGYPDREWLTMREEG